MLAAIDLGTESDDEGEEVDEVVKESAVLRLSEDHLDPEIHAETDDEEVQSGAPPSVGYESFAFENKPDGWEVPTAPEGWFEKEETRARKNNEPAFAEVDNPGRYDPFIYQPKFNKAGQYIGHFLPTGCTVVPPTPQSATGGDQQGRSKKRKVDDWEFFYDGSYKNTNDTQYRSEATRDNLFPESRRSKLDIELLVNVLGLDRDRMIDDKGLPDALWFYQLLLPIAETSRIPDDPRKNFYVEVAIFSNIYETRDLRIGATGLDSHHDQCKPNDFLKFDGVLLMDGVKGGCNGAMYRLWKVGDALYCDEIVRAMTKERWHHMKRIYKLCDNSLAKKRGEEGYDPAYKYRFIWDVLIHNINAISTKSCDDQCVDESTYAFGGFGEAKSGIISLIKGKPGCSKGGQVVLSVDVDRRRPRAIVHRHKHLHPYLTVQGQNEIVHLHKQMKDLSICDSSKLHFTCDNFFSGTKIFNYACEQKFGMTSTVRRDRLPENIPSKYLCKEKTNSSARPKAARYVQPVVAVQKYAGGTQVLTSFQSTSSCNIMCVNALNACSLYGQEKERGRNQYKRRWLIEMNDARKVYLTSYNKVDVLDHYIQQTPMRYVSWKYWHSGMNHAKPCTVAVAYDIYKEIASGIYNQKFKVRAVEFHDFKQKLSKQMLSYDPKDGMYPGDASFRIVTRLPKQRRRNRDSDEHVTVASSSTPSVRHHASSITAAHLEQHRNRCCGDLSEYAIHHRSAKAIPNEGRRKCKVCNEYAGQQCGKCGVALHLHKPPNAISEVSCFLEYHNSCFLGLACCDYKMLTDRNGKKINKNEWKYPTDHQKKRHANNVRDILT